MSLVCSLVIQSILEPIYKISVDRRRGVTVCQHHYADGGLTGIHVSNGKCFQRIGDREMALQSSLNQGKNGGSQP